MAELLLELFSEEIPARMQAPAAGALVTAVREGLGERGIEVAAEAVRPFATPRRIGLVAVDLPPAAPQRTVKRRGPRVDAPEQAQAGFRRSLDGAAYTLEQVREGKGTFWVAVVEEGGEPLGDIVRAVVESLLPRFPWPKSMRWGAGDARWVRPLQRILCLVDGTVVPVRFAGLEAGRLTAGHRFAAPTPFAVGSAAEHADRLLAAKVVVDPAERRRRIVEGTRTLAASEGLAPIDDAGLVDELVGLTEWPVPLLGRIDDQFMNLPPEVLTTSMRNHQKYLALVDGDGRLAPRFVVVANLDAPDAGRAIVAGNERVLRARLWDARFFWDADRAQGLDGREPALARMVFHGRLGSVADKARRLAVLAGWLAERLQLGEPAAAARAGALAKADLVTAMVGEFPELQGVMGAYYARAMGEPEPVARAIGEHYAPQGPADHCPTAPTSVAVSLADKLDSLVGFVAAGERATGSKDPLGLRRLALGVLRLVFENGLRLPLVPAIREALAGYGATLAEVDADALARELVAFVADRLKVHLRDEGLGADLVTAVFEAKVDDDMLRLAAKARAVGTFVGTVDGANLLAAHRRARNIVRIEAKRDGAEPTGPVLPELLVEPAERALYDDLGAAAERIERALASEDFVGAMADLASLRGPVDRFFEDVLVNAPDPAVRANRLRLLARLGGLLDGVAAFDRLDDARPAS